MYLGIAHSFIKTHRLRSCELKGRQMKRAFSSIAAIAIVSAMAATAMAQDGLPGLWRNYARCVPSTGPVARFDNGYLDSHPQVAQQLNRDPRLADNPQFLATHPGLDSYLATHPQVRARLQQHPGRFMNGERNYER